MKLSDKIRILRKARGLSQEQFGYSIAETTAGVSRQTVSDWENGKFEPKLDNIRDIAKVLNVSFDVLLDESIDLNDAEVLKKVLHNVPVNIKTQINTKTRYDICVYSIDKKVKRNLALYIVDLCLLVISVVMVVLGAVLNIAPLYIVGGVSAFISVVFMPTSIILIVTFCKQYKNPRGVKVAEINNTHIIIHTYQVASNIVYLPIDKVKDIALGENATNRCGDIQIVLSGHEKPITLVNIASPQEAIDTYHKIIERQDDADGIRII